MKLNTTWSNDTTAVLEITVDEQELTSIKEKVVRKLAPTVKATGFRAGHVPSAVVEKQIGSNRLQAEVLDEALNTVYSAALKQEGLRPAGRPEVSVEAFVPYSQLKCILTVSCIGEVKLGKYEGLKSKPTVSKVTAKEIDKVIDNLATRIAEKKEVKRAAKNGDEAWIDFEGKDPKGKPIERADGKDYPLLLGSKTFIPGFEENLVGLKPGTKKSFTVTFPDDYGVATLKNKKVTFEVTLNKIQEIIKPELNDEFAKQMGPFENFAQLKADIEKQLQVDKDNAARSDYEAKTIQEISKNSDVAIPENIIDEQASAMVEEFKRDLVSRSQTLQEFLKGEGVSEEEYLTKTVKPAARDRIKAGLVLSEIASKEGITVSEDELNDRIKQLKAQYQDEQMQKELDKIENLQDVAARILSEKTIKFLTT
ncbi:MAG: trigger factor [bacterium]|nr:trigger factor [bacterium]